MSREAGDVLSNVMTPPDNFTGVSYTTHLISYL